MKESEYLLNLTYLAVSVTEKFDRGEMSESEQSMELYYTVFGLHSRDPHYGINFEATEESIPLTDIKMFRSLISVEMGLDFRGYE